ncbi:MAG: hypothetical protein HZB80_07830 [Deltaproteobacteria bacterium]|nr:hypothetical protein [Deltaproteobacteria bacterium]
MQQKGKVVVAVSGERSMSKFLKRRADKYILIDDNQTEKHKPYFYRNFLR